MADENGSGGEEGPRKPLYTPHLKRVLKSYQAAATTSLHGPDSIMGASGVRLPGPPRAARREPEPFVAPPPFPIQQPPLFAPADQGEGRCERSETVLEGETISCFCVGGEERLCLPQILNTVLQAFSLHQINGVCDSMHIFCSRCNSEQLEVLKAEGVLPLSAPSCGLITKTDAERLCAALVDPNPPRYPPSQDSPFKIPVYHECFGRCKGTYSPDLYCDPGARCIECSECKGVLSPQKFVCHAHHSRENRTCHWGFDSFRWRSYLLLDDEEENGKDPQFKELLKQMKSRFDYNHKYKRKQILAESCDPSVKRVHVDCGPPPIPYGTLDPSLVCWYGSPLWGRPGLIAGPDGKAFYLAPALPDTLFKDRLDLGPKLDGLVPENQVTLTYHVREERKPKKEPIRSPCRTTAPDSSEDALSDTSFSTLSAGTEDGLVSNVDDLEEEVCPTTEGELRQLDEILTEVEAPLRTKILTEVESLIAKYRKCLSVAVQGKKLYQMELEKFNYVQRGKIRKLRETNKYLEKKMRRLQQVIGEESGEPPPLPEVPGVEEEEEEKPSENEPFSTAEGGGMQDAEEMCDSAAEGPTDV